MFALSFLGLSTRVAPAGNAIDEWALARPPEAPKLRATTLDARKTALVMMDFDGKSCTSEKRSRCFDAIPAVAGLLARARDKQMLVVHYFNANISRDDIVPALAPKSPETAEQKSGDKFFNSNLDALLRSRNIDTVILAGTSANGAVLATAPGAFEHNFKAIVPVDCIPADGVWQEQFSIWEIANGPGFREVSTVTRTDMLNF